MGCTKTSVIGSPLVMPAADAAAGPCPAQLASVDATEAPPSAQETPPAASEQKEHPCSDEALLGLAPEARRWDGTRFRLERKLQDASRNEGAVHLMKDTEAGTSVAVKQMPLTWTQRDARAFKKAQPNNTEQPWLDVAILKHLCDKGCSFICQFYGVFYDDQCLYVVSALATEGDLFDWCATVKESPGPAREAVVQPVVRQLCTAVRALHECGVCHRDMSMENALMHRDADGSFSVKLVDFGMATVSRHRRDEVRGKYPYQAPEMHRAPDGAYDGFLSDAFAVGVVVFCLALRDYPWRSTRPGDCKAFELASQSGVADWLVKRKLPGARGKTLADAVSEPFRRLVVGLLDLDPARRLTLGEGSFAGARRSVWTGSSWLGPDQESDIARVTEQIEEAWTSVDDSSCLPKIDPVGSGYMSACAARPISFDEIGPQFDMPAFVRVPVEPSVRRSRGIFGRC